MSTESESQQVNRFTTSCDSQTKEEGWSQGQAVRIEYQGCACVPSFEEAELGDIIQIDFLDHVQDSTDGPLECTVYGSLTDIGDNYLTVTSWQGCEDNTTTFTIITSCISGLVVFNQPSSQND